MKKDFRDAAFSVVHDLMRADPGVVVLTNDMGAQGLDAIRAEFPNRAINVGISEQNMISLAGGLASTGKRVFCYGIIAHLMRAWEQIKVDICMPNLPVTILGVGAGLSYGPDGPTHHGTEDLALMRVLSNMTIYNPADWVCAEAVVRMAAEARTPHYIRLDKEQLGPIYSTAQDFSKGYAVFGDDLQDVIVSTGIETQRARRLDRRCVVDVYRLKPAPDIADYLIELHDKGPLEIWDEHHPNGGLFSIVAEMLCTAEHKTLPDRFLLGATHREPFADRPLAMFDDGYGFQLNG
jgi:transketolase